jgi:PHS family inorganic phosphate transporter-like MFS transporter
VAFLFIDSWGRKPIQLMGFTILAITFIGMGLSAKHPLPHMFILYFTGFGYDKLVATAAGRKTFVFLYCLINFFQNFGPNTTTFIIPGEIFPTRYRSTAHGIAAASGKLGAIVAQVAFFKLDPGSSNSSASVKHM